MVQSLHGSVEAENRRHIFINPQIIAVTINDVYLDGMYETVAYTACEVYAPRGIASMVCWTSVLKKLSISIS